MPADIESVKNPKVGSFYGVNVAVLTALDAKESRHVWSFFGSIELPINGPWHEDKEIIKFEFDQCARC
jgi:hypothetical protein